MFDHAVGDEENGPGLFFGEESADENSFSIGGGKPESIGSHDNPLGRRFLNFIQTGTFDRKHKITLRNDPDATTTAREESAAPASGLGEPGGDRYHSARWTEPDPRRQSLKTLHSAGADETVALGKYIGQMAPGGAILAFRGDLGAGKTTMAKGIAAGLGVSDEVTSPTFTIISEYEGRLRLCHVDAWRLGSFSEFEEIGGFDMVSGPDTLLLVEWSERLADNLPVASAIVDIRVLPDGSRSIRIEGEWLELLIPDLAVNLDGIAAWSSLSLSGKAEKQNRIAPREKK